MSTEIAVRLPDHLVAQVDAVVAGGWARSRSDVLERALRRELRRQAEEDLVRLGADGYGELAGFTDAAVPTAMELDCPGRSTWMTRTEVRAVVAAAGRRS